jgi:hypothetical protein
MSDSDERLPQPPRLPRRAFLRRGARATLGAYALTLAGRAGAEEDDKALDFSEPRVRRFKTLGNTGLSISDISMGTSRTRRAGVVRHAFDRGINYFDTAESYQDGESEKAVGQALHGVRDQVFIATKTITRPDDSWRTLMDRLHSSLTRLQTDHVDVYFNHAVNNLARLKIDAWYEFATRAKQQGKIRFTGMSGHGGRLIDCLNHALDNDLIDVVLAAYNFGQDPAFYERFTANFDFVANQVGLPKVLAKAKSKGVGVIAMKTLMGGRLNDLAKYEWPGSTFPQAAFRWVLSSANVDALIVSMKERQQIDRYLAASGRSAVRARDLRLLDDYASRNGAAYCRPACDACEASCPKGVPISDVLRARMYAVDYEDPAFAADAYAKLGAGASPCATCADQPCLGSCPYGLPIPDLTGEAARRLGRG